MIFKQKLGTGESTKKYIPTRQIKLLVDVFPVFSVGIAGGGYQ